jgi:hypothetical protein
MTGNIFLQGKPAHCQGCGRQLRSGNTIGYCQGTPECRRIYKRIQSARLRAASRINAECENCGSRLRSDNRSGYCNAPECHQIWERVRAQLRRTDDPDNYRAYNREYKRSHREQTALIRAKRRALKCGVPFRLTIELLPPIPDTCPVLGVPFACGEGRPVPESLTLDRIDPDLGYVPGNVMWLSHRANAMKQDASLEQLQQFARWALTLR